MGSRKDFLEVGVVRELTFSTYKKAHLLKDEECALAVQKSLFQAKVRLGFHLYSYVIMSNHVHLVFMLPQHVVPISKILTSIKSTSGKHILQILQSQKSDLLHGIETSQSGSVVQKVWMAGGGYERSLRDDQSILNAIEYIHSNPVKAGLVKEPIEYEFSSARAFYTGDYSEIDPMPRVNNVF